MSDRRGAVVGVVMFAVTCLAPPAAAQPRLIGADLVGGRLYDVNLATGAATSPRATGIDLLNGIAWSPAGVLYGLSNRDASSRPNSLFRIDPLTGASTLVGATGLSAAVEGDLAFQPTTGVLFGLQEVGTNGRELFTLNTSTGAATLIGRVGGTGTQAVDDLSAMAFTPDGRLLMLENSSTATAGDRLLTVDPVTGALLSSVPLSVNIGPISGLALDPATGVFYAVDGGPPSAPGTNSLYRLNPDTGALTRVGPTGLAEGLASLAFVPEPGAATALLVVIGLLGLRRRRRD